MVVAFLLLDLRTVSALGQIFSVLNIQRSHRGPTGRQMTCGPFGISISGGAEFRFRPTNLAKPDEQVVYLLVGSHDCRLSLHITQRTNWLERRGKTTDKRMVINHSLTWSPREFRGWFVPLEPIGDTMRMNVLANAHISVPIRHQRLVRSQEDSEREKTYISQAAHEHRKAVFGPTPGSEQSSSTVFGTSESNSSRRRSAACRICLGFMFFCQSSLLQRTKGRCGDELCLATPESHFADGVCDDLLLRS